MALFSRRKKSDAPADAADGSAEALEETAEAASAPAGDNSAAENAEQPAESIETVPTIDISVQAFRGVGAAAGPAVALPDGGANVNATDGAATSRRAASSAPTMPTEPAERKLPLAPLLPPEQTETVAGMKDNVLLREALKEITEGASNEQLLGVMRQALQGHLYLRVHGDARQQISEGKPLSVGVLRDGDRSFMLAFSSAGAVRDSVQLESDPAATSAVAQPVTAVMQQVIAGGFTGLIIDNASAPHRAVFPTELLQRSLEQGDAEMTIKTIIAAPREADSAQRVGDALAKTQVWVAVNDGGGTGEVGIAEAQTADGKRFLQVFSHPLEVIALGRGDQPMPFKPEQLAKVLSEHPEMSGVVVDSAGPTIVVERDALGAVLVLAVDLGD